MIVNLMAPVKPMAPVDGSRGEADSKPIAACPADASEGASVSPRPGGPFKARRKPPPFVAAWVCRCAACLHC